MSTSNWTFDDTRVGDLVGTAPKTVAKMSAPKACALSTVNPLKVAGFLPRGASV